jgi:acyl-CoA dehydrogenase family protein 9
MDLNRGIAKELFLGKLLTENLTPFPAISGEEAETVKMLTDTIDKFLGEYSEKFREYDVKGAQPQEYIDQLKEMGLFGLIIPEENGGVGLSNAAYSRVVQQTSRHDASTSLTIGAHSSIGMKGLVLFGSSAQKAKYGPKLATGEMIAAFCLTEPGAGSDAASIKTRAEKRPDGSWILNGEKIWITNGGIADFFTVFARTDSPRGRMSAFIVERRFGGVTNGPKEDKMGIRASITTTVNFDNCIVPAENLLGEEGEGFKVAMAILNNGRTGLGGGCVGGMKTLIGLSTKYASERKQFGKPIAEFPIIQEKIAQMTVDCFAAESAVSVVASLIDSGHSDYSVEAAIAKVFGTEALWRSCYEGLQIAGGNGFMREYPYERMTRDCRIFPIFEGTNEVLRMMIALTGAKHAGASLNAVAASVKRALVNPADFLSKGLGYLQRRIAHRFGFSFNNRVFDCLSESDTSWLDEGAVSLSISMEKLLRKYGKKIIDQQIPCKRLADSTIDLFVGFAVTARVAGMVKEFGAEKCKDEIRIMRIFSAQARRRLSLSLNINRRADDVAALELSQSIFKSGYRWDSVR